MKEKIELYQGIAQPKVDLQAHSHQYLWESEWNVPQKSSQIPSDNYPWQFKKMNYKS